mmetsp:Transcript_123846/g.194257  ORF Transcript_123846/g.194257 Transcript_123846/m.194257 type:complete len:169 (-) Transcript_123846:65-571(-)
MWFGVCFALLGLTDALRVQQRSQGTLMQIIQNNTMVNAVRQELEYELRIQSDARPIKSKIAFVLLAMLVGICGVDRCFVGQVCVGITKALTLGGCGVWCLIDYAVVVVNAFSKSPKIDTFFGVRFDEDTVQAALIIAIILFTIQCLATFYCCCSCFRYATGSTAKEIQ